MNRNDSIKKDDIFGEVFKDLNRRNFLKAGALGLIGAGLSFGGLKVLEEDAFGEVIPPYCDHILVMAKHGTTLKVPYFECLPCSCPDQQIIKQTIITRLVTAPSCDETKDIIPDGSRLIVRLTRISRTSQLGPHGKAIGCHKGTFTLKDPSGVILASGKMKGIDGMTANHPLYGTDFCDQWWHDEGCLEGKGRIGTKLENCTLHGTYVSFLETGVFWCVKEPWMTWNIHLTVCLHCPCPTVG